MLIGVSLQVSTLPPRVCDFLQVTAAPQDSILMQNVTPTARVRISLLEPLRLLLLPPLLRIRKKCNRQVACSKATLSSTLTMSLICLPLWKPLQAKG